MPPYDEQTQAFIDGEGLGGEDCVQTCALMTVTCTHRAREVGLPRWARAGPE